MHHWIKVMFLLLVLAAVFFLSGWWANYLLSVTGCVYTSGGMFSVTFLGLGAAIMSVINWFWDLHTLF